jgi:hypothetical protein
VERHVARLDVLGISRKSWRETHIAPGRAARTNRARRGSNKEHVMRLTNPIVILLAVSSLSSLAGCANRTVVRSADSSVHAEPRRVSAATAEDPIPSYAQPRRGY